MTTETDNINVRVAEAMGWKKDYECVDHHENPTIAWRNPDGHEGPWGDDYLPRYATDETTAMTLCERLKGEGWECDLSTEEVGWSCSFYKEENQRYKSHTETAPTLAMAICLAFLKTIEKSPLDEKAKSA